MSLQVKGGPDGLAIFETNQAYAEELAGWLVGRSVSFYCEPWVDGLFHTTVNGEAGHRVEVHLKTLRRPFHRLPIQGKT